MKVVAETARLTLRTVTLDDAPFMLTLMNQGSFLRNIGDRGVRTLDDARKYIVTKTLAQYREWGFGMYLLELKSKREVIGSCGLVSRDGLPGPDLGFALIDAYEGQGYASEAAQAVLAHARNDLGIRELLAITTLANERSGKLLLKLGFQPRGTIRLGAEELRLFAREGGAE